MSRSSYRETTTEDRDYDDRRERERERARTADRYDEKESRHHGRWTASQETADLEGTGYTSQPRRSLSRKDSRDDSDREGRHHRLGRSSSYSNIPTPPPMPPTNFYEHQGTYRSSHPYGSTSYHGNNYYGAGQNDYGMSGYGNHYSTRSANYGHPSYGNHGSYGSGYDHYTSGYGQGSDAYGQDLYTLSHPSQFRGVHPIQRAFLSQQGHSGYGQTGYGHHGLGSGYGQHYGSGYGQHYGSGYGQHYGSGYGQHYGSGYGQTGYGQHYGSGYGQDSYALSHPSQFRGVHPIQRAFLSQQGQPHLQHGYGTRSLGQTGYGQTGYGHQTGVHPNPLFEKYHLYELHGFHMARPHADIYELGNDYIIELDLPGHTRDHVDIKLSGNELFVISKPPKRDYNWHINERWLGRHNVERKFYLPTDVNGAGISPVLANGVLRLTLPRTAAATTAPLHGKTTTTNDTTTTTTTTTQATTL